MSDQQEKERSIFVFGLPSTLHFRPGPDGRPIEVPRDPIIIKPPPPPTTTTILLPGIHPLSFQQLEEALSAWTDELQVQERDFITEASRLNYFAKVVNENSDKIVHLKEAMDAIHKSQCFLEMQLETVKENQMTLEDDIASLEASVEGLSIGDSGEREETFLKSVGLSKEFKEINGNLKTIVNEINMKNSAGNKSDPISQIVHILNSHTDMLQWVETTIKEIKTQLDSVVQNKEKYLQDYDKTIQDLLKTSSL